MADANVAGVLVVDDEQFFREVLRDMLQKDGLRVVAEAASGDEAVEMFRKCSPELVLMDIYMPGKNGIEATREIIALAPTAKILICSGTGYDDDIAAALQAGARGIIYKPFFDEEVMATINSLLAA
jgi:two-component system chemotaxis response regulator CheY